MFSVRDGIRAWRKQPESAGSRTCPTTYSRSGTPHKEGKDQKNERETPANKLFYFVHREDASKQHIIKTPLGLMLPLLNFTVVNNGTKRRRDSDRI